MAGLGRKQRDQIPLVGAWNGLGVERHACMNVLYMFSYSMNRERLSSILLAAPAWVRLGLTVPDSRLRERAADALAATIVDKLEEPGFVSDRNQLHLPL
jgi:hypothetical protein